MNYRYGLIIIALTAAAPVHAADTTEVVVRANRFAVFRGDTVVSSVDIDKAGLGRGDSIDQSLKLASQAALFRRSSSLTANPTVQGLSLRAIAPSGAGRALVTLDGIPQNDPFGGWVIWAAIPQGAVSHAHIVRGAGGGAYGAGALTGVVDLDLAPPPSVGFAATVEAGEGGSHRVALNGAVGDFALYATSQEMHGDSPVRAPQRGAADVATFGRDKAVLLNYQKAICPFGVCGQFDVLAGHYDSVRATGLAGATARARGDNDSLSFTRAATTEENGFRVQVWHKTSDLANRSVAVAAGRTGTTLANDQVATPATGDGLAWAIRHQTTGQEWEIGVNAQTARGTSKEYYRYMPAATRYRETGGHTSLAGVYGEGAVDSGPWTVTGALRVDQWKTYSGHRHETDLVNHVAVLDLHPAARTYVIASGRAGVAYALSLQTTVRAAAYTGFRPPSLNELYRPFRVGNDVTEANADLKPEVLTGVEFGVRHTRLVDADLFWNVVQDPVSNVTIGRGPATFPTAGFIPSGGTLRQRQNVGEIAAYGVEWRGAFALTSNTEVTASATATHARVRKAFTNPQLDGKRPAQAPDYSATVGVTGNWQPVTVSADLSFDGKAFEDDLNTLVLKPSQRLNLSVDYAVGRHVTVYADIDNVLDSRIQIAHGGDGTLSFDTGRRVTIGLSYKQ